MDWRPGIAIACLLGVAGAPAVAKETPCTTPKVVSGEVVVEVVADEGREREMEAVQVPGFEVRGFEGRVTRVVKVRRKLRLGIECLGSKGRAEHLRFVLENASDDLVTVLSVRPEKLAAPFRWARDLEFPLELDLDEWVPLLTVEVDRLSPGRVELVAEVEDGADEHWTVVVTRPDSPRAGHRERGGRGSGD